jgi:hypothetical protein
MRFPIDLDPETASALIKSAVANRRPMDWQAEVLLRQALGLPVPWPPAQSPETPDETRLVPA